MESQRTSSCCLVVFILSALCLQGLSLSAEQTEFCAALEQLAADASSPSHQSCTALDCAVTCTTEIGGSVLESQSTFSLCSDPPTYSLVVSASGMVVLNETLSDSEIVRTPMFVANVTVHQLESALAIMVQTYTGTNRSTNTLFNYTVLPYDPSLCPENISGSHFPCPPLSSRAPATTVHELKPSDVKVIAAIGNSLTAGLFIRGNPVEYKGLAFSGGGFSSLEYVTTLPNILKEYNPELIGFATETELDLSNRTDQSLNVGVTLAETTDLMRQTQLLVQRIRDNPNIDVDSDWKVVTVLMGYNDVCIRGCSNGSLELVEQWIDNVDQALIYLKDNSPRTFVNLVHISMITLGQQYTEGAPHCRSFLDRNCMCVFAGGDSNAVAIADRVTLRFQQGLNSLVNSRKYDTSNDFTVVIQPFLENAQRLRDADGNIDTSVLALDCVHLSPTGNRVYATALWNNMLQPVGSKETAILGREPFTCPSDEQPFFYTHLNTFGCPPLCTHKFCSARETRTALCTIPGPREIPGCTGNCQLTSCRACYYSDTVRDVPETDEACTVFPISPGGRCFRKWSIAVRRANGRVYGRPRRDLRNQENFKCYRHPCPLRG